MHTRVNRPNPPQRRSVHLPNNPLPTTLTGVRLTSFPDPPLFLASPPFVSQLAYVCIFFNTRDPRTHAKPTVAPLSLASLLDPTLGPLSRRLGRWFAELSDEYGSDKASTHFYHRHYGHLLLALARSRAAVKMAEIGLHKFLLYEALDDPLPARPPDRRDGHRGRRAVPRRRPACLPACDLSALLPSSFFFILPRIRFLAAPKISVCVGSGILGGTVNVLPKATQPTLSHKK